MTSAYRVPARPPKFPGMEFRLRVPALLLAGVLAGPGIAHGQAAGSHTTDVHAPPPSGVHDATQTDHHGEFLNEFMFFVGDTRKGGENEFTVGFDYLRTLGSHWGVGIFLDYARGEFEREYIAGAGLFWAPIPAAPDLHLFGGLGYERLNEDHGGHGEWESEDLLLGRLGGTWLFHFGDRGRWVLAPQAFWDIVRGNDAAVFGVGLGYLF